jgi:hypothetical protein
MRSSGNGFRLHGGETEEAELEPIESKAHKRRVDFLKPCPEFGGDVEKLEEATSEKEGPELIQVIADHKEYLKLSRDFPFQPEASGRIDDFQPLVVHSVVFIQSLVEQPGFHRPRPVFSEPQTVIFLHNEKFLPYFLFMISFLRCPTQRVNPASTRPVLVNGAAV